MSNGYSTIFGGDAVYPSNQTYAAIDLTSDITLSWPIESVSSEIIVADLIDVTPGVPGGWNVKLPDATGGSNGITMIFNNLSNIYDFNVTDNAGNMILNVPPGTVWLVYLADNSTQIGVWRTFQYGAQSGSVNVAAIAGAGLLAIGSSLNQSMPVSAKGTDYVIVTDDRASVILWTGAAGNLTLPAPSSVGNNWFVNIANKGTGNVVVTPSSGLIDGAASKNFTSGTGSAIVFTDGSNYYTLGFGGSGSTSGFNYTTINAAGSDGVNNPIVLSGGQLDKVSYMVFGILTGTRTIIVPSTVQQYWINNATTSAAGVGSPYSLTIKTATGSGVTVSQPGQAIMYCDGSGVVPAVSGISLPVAISAGGTGATTAPAALTSLGGTSIGTALFTSPSANTARTVTLGAGATGNLIFQAATPSAALTAMNGGTLTGALTITGALTVSGLLTVVNQITADRVAVVNSTLPQVGIYRPAASQLGFTTNTLLAGYFDVGQILNLTHPLPIASGGTSGNTVATAAAALGDTANSVNTLALRDGSANLLTNFYRMAGGVDNLALINVMYDAGDGFLRRKTLANFAAGINSLITPDALSTANAGPPNPPSYSARAWARVSSTGTLLAGQNIASAGRSGLGIYFVTFSVAMPNANYAVIATCQHATGNFIMAASEADSTQVTKTASQVGIYVGVPGASSDQQISVVIYC